MPESGSEEITYTRKFTALVRVAKYRPVLTTAILVFGVLAASLEALGVSFILPIVEIIQSPGSPADQSEGMVAVFVSVYRILNLDFTLGSVILGVGVILTIRWTTTFFVRWLRGALEIAYIRSLQSVAFESALDARVEYFDREGSDDILNAIVTQAEYSGRVIRFIINFLEQFLISLMYLAIAFIIAPLLTVFAVVMFGIFMLIFRTFVETGYDLGENVAEANVEIQQVVQAGTQGIRETKLFGLKRELYGIFLDSVDKFERSGIKLRRNEEAIQSFYNLLSAISVFVLIYLSISLLQLSLGQIGVFLFAMFRLGPKVSAMNSHLYRVDNNLPHLVRTQDFVRELELHRELSSNSESVPDEIHQIEFDSVHFSYPTQEDEALSGVSFGFETGDYIGFVGKSGAGKSTIVSLLTRFYEPDRGEIRANGRPIHDMDVDDWRSHFSVVQQDPFIFNDTLRYNLTIGNRDASMDDIARACEIAKVDEFFDGLPNGYDTQLGDDGVKLSGGQRQRVALARALLKDSDVLVLDEATSDLDSNLEKQVKESIEQMERDYSIIGIAHRLSTIMNADRIYTLNAGEITEVGSHTELLHKGGEYAELYSMQSGES